ncbi:MAG: plastocyanin/azurin family copper-binding protein [Actinomycetota bacterium]|nr:plastocyanin/azurin family copper-binding protein [Actinomycetota bacterium]
MDNETLFYLCGGIAAVSAVILTFAGLKLKNFPGRILPLVVVWFAFFAVAASAFAVRYSAEEAEHREHEIHEAAEKIEEGSSGPYENEAGALGGEREELEEEAEEEAEGSGEEEPVGPTESPQEKGDDSAEEGQKGSEGATGASSGGEASATTLQLAADPEELLYDKEELSAKAGKITIEFTNPSAIPHNVVIEKDGKELAGFEPISDSEESLSTDLETGSYMYVCTVPGHEEAGMVGTLTVE